ncbi:MAG: phosphoglycerate dehydrogenase [Coriobacteriales bacterium]|jgi:D-3-phosphoglycerate dehydrogenase|nr:phosphoglycerate dehydrogenase [Coriobacteriales bacterium]
MKVLVSEKLADKGIELLREAGHEVDVKLELSPEELVETIPDYEALIVRSATQATREVIEAGTQLKIIGRAGVGVDNVDVTAATERGVIVCNAPTSNVISAAEQTMALLLSCARRTPQANASMKAGKWDRGKFTGNEMYEKTLAIFGLGRIGGLVAERAKSFGMELIGFDPYCSPERAAHLGVTLYEDINDILPLADFITVHLPKTKETIGMFSAPQFAKMKDTVYLVNTARGGIYDVEALAEALRTGAVAGAAIDVYEKEPCTVSALHELDNCILTPHLGASTKEAQLRAGEQIAEYVLLGLEGKMVPTAVNVTLMSEDVMSAVAPYIEACQTCGEILAQLADEGISAIEVKVMGDLAEHDVSLLATAALRGIFSHATDDPVNLVNASYLAEQRGVKVSVVKDPLRYEYASVVSISAKAGTQDLEVGCTISGPNNVMRIVSVFGYKLDLIPRNNILVLRYEDTPGKLGRIGTVLGNANINISTMEIGTNEAGTGEAVVLMNLDSPVPAEVYTELCTVVGVCDSWAVKL